MSTAKWQIIAGSKKFFSLGRICYSALKWRRDFRQVQKHSNRVISYIVCHLILHILNRASELTVGTAEAQQWVTSVANKIKGTSIPTFLGESPYVLPKALERLLGWI